MKIPTEIALPNYGCCYQIKELDTGFISFFPHSAYWIFYGTHEIIALWRQKGTQNRIW